MTYNLFKKYFAFFCVLLWLLIHVSCSLLTRVLSECYVQTEGPQNQWAWRSIVWVWSLWSFGYLGTGQYSVISTDACILLRDMYKTWELISLITVLKCISSFCSHPFLMSSLISFTIDLLFSELIAQVRNSTTILTREFIDALPNGWEDYAWRRINKGVLLLVPYLKTFFRINKSWMIM